MANSYLPASIQGPRYIELPPWHTDDWDRALFDGEECPGLVKIVDPSRGPKWDRKPVAGQTGESQTFKGWNNADFKIEIRTWTTSQHADFVARILPILEPEPGKEAPKEVGITHPATSARKIESFKIENLTGPSANYKEGYTLWTIDAFQALKKVPQKGGGKPGMTPCQQCKAMYEQKVAEYQAAMSDYSAKLAAVAPADEITAASQKLQAAQDSMTNQANICRENGCDNESPSQSAQSGGAPPP